jgi:hypothetical protein
MLRFGTDSTDHHPRDDATVSVIAQDVMEVLERGMRNLVLSSHAVESSRASSADSVSFKITLHVPEENHSCPELNRAFDTGTWYAPNSSNNNNSKTETRPGLVLRPLHQFADVPELVGTILFAKRTITRKRDNRKSPPRSADHT